MRWSIGADDYERLIELYVLKAIGAYGLVSKAQMLWIPG